MLNPGLLDKILCINVQAVLISQQQRKALDRKQYIYINVTVVALYGVGMWSISNLLSIQHPSRLAHVKSRTYEADSTPQRWPMTVCYNQLLKYFVLNTNANNYYEADSTPQVII